MDSGGGGVRGRAESERILTIAASLLDSGDLIGCRQLAESAISMDPLADSALADQIIAASDVLLAAKSHASPSPHAILNIPPASAVAAASSAFRRLALLLRNPSPLPAANAAFHIAADAFAIIAGPDGKPPLIREGASTAACADPVLAFWTACPSCFNILQYPREFADRMLRCHTCKRPFKATEMQMPPPIVPGTDMYYCSWGFHPVGIPSTADLSNWKPFIPIAPLPPSITNAKAKRKREPKRKTPGIIINEWVPEINLNHGTESAQKNAEEPPSVMMSEPLNVQPLRTMGVSSSSHNIGVGDVAVESQEENPGISINEGSQFKPNQEA